MQKIATRGVSEWKFSKRRSLPNKTIYSINSGGKKKFRELMVFYSSNFRRWNFEFNAFIWHLEKLDKKQDLKMLRNLGKELRLKEMWLKKHESELISHIPFSARMILKQYTMMTTTLVDWVDGAIEDYKKLNPSRERKYNISAVKKIHDN